MVRMAQPGIGTELEGVHAVAAAVAAGRVERLVVERSRRGALEDLVAEAKRTGADIDEVDDLTSRAVTSAPQGVAATCRPIPAASLEEAAARSEPAALVVLDRLEDPRNVGAVARSALAAGFGGIVVSTRRAAPLSAAAFKAAAGAFEHLAIVPVSSVADAVEQARRIGLWSVGLAASAPQTLFGLGILTEPVAVVIGAEGEGLSRLVAERCDVLASIPIDARVESLNASVAAAVAVFEVARARG
jgi:23S rRNA (guanosine2251-2'-O)-methyltransferase